MKAADRDRDAIEHIQDFQYDYPHSLPSETAYKLK